MLGRQSLKRKLTLVLDNINRVRNIDSLSSEDERTSDSETRVAASMHREAENQIPSEESVHEEMMANGEANEKKT